MDTSFQLPSNHPFQWAVSAEYRPVQCNGLILLKFYMEVTYIYGIIMSILRHESRDSISQQIAEYEPTYSNADYPDRYTNQILTLTIEMHM